MLYKIKFDKIKVHILWDKAIILFLAGPKTEIAFPAHSFRTNLFIANWIGQLNELGVVWHNLRRKVNASQCLKDE